MQDPPVQAHIPVQVHLNIPTPPPFLLHLGAPLIPWPGWAKVFSSYLHLLEENQGTVLPDTVRNSLLLGLLRTWGLQQLAESPVITVLATATHVAFVQMVAGHFKRLLSTVCDNQGVQDQKLESAEPDVAVKYGDLESDERSQAGQLTPCSRAPYLIFSSREHSH